MGRVARGTCGAVLAIALASCGPGPKLADGLPDPIQCDSCHGDLESPAPPRGVRWGAAPTEVEVGAHRLHLRDSSIRAAIGCADCHVVPASVDAPGHVDGPHATVTFSPLADGGGLLDPQWNRETATCSQVYCHGASLPGGPTAMTWTFAVEPDPSRPEACGGCHPIPGLSGAHAAHFALRELPPAATYGDLRTRADYSSAEPGYAFGCGNCHPTDLAAHVDGTIQVELTGGPPGSVKARNGAGASFAADKTCSEVYCHSSGQQAPAFAVTPPWDSGTRLGCDGCHGNPPRYESGGGGTTTANSHLTYGLNGFSYGHFSWHDMMTTTTTEPNGMHGVHDANSDGASPMTCQTCHYGTVDPANSGPSGFYYLDTSGDYTLPDRPAPAAVGPASFGCTVSGCHTGLPGEPPKGLGRVLPGRHVNGVRDVVFDPRTGPPSSGLPRRSALPSRAYWVAAVIEAGFTTPDADGGFDPPTGTQTASTLSLHLLNATYDPITKTCASVACHVKAYEGTPKQAWGAPAQAGDRSGCGNCHVGP